MAIFLANRVHVEVSTSGTADFVVGSAISTAYQSFSGASVPDGATFSYVAYTATQFECARGAYILGTTTVDRTAANVIAGSAGAGALTNFSTNPRLFIGPLAEDLIPGGADTQVQFNDAGVFGGDPEFIYDKTNDLLVIGHTASVAAGSAHATLQAHHHGGTDSGIALFGWTNAGINGSIFDIVTSRGGLGVNTALVAEDRIGRIFFRGADGTEYPDAAAIIAAVDGSVTTGSVPGRLTFYTRSAGGSDTERLRIDSAGVMSIGVGGLFEFPERTTPSNPAADKIRLYAKDVGGISKLFHLDSAGTEKEIAAGIGSTTKTITAIIDGSGSAITTGIKGDLEVPYACTINQVTMLADQSGSIVVDIWKDSYANYPPTDADSITASAVPTITTAVKSQDATLIGWTTAIAAGDILRFNVDSVTTITRLTLSIRVTVT